MPDMRLGEEHEFSHGGVTTQYYIVGKGSPLVFFHGLGVTPVTYAPVILELARYYTVYAPQIPVFGRSGVPGTMWDYTDFARYFDAFLRKNKLSDIAAVGHSFGGGIALALAATSPRVSRAVSANPAGILENPVQTFVLRVVYTCVLYLAGKPTLTLRMGFEFFETCIRRIPSFTHAVKICVNSVGSYPRFLSTIQIPVLVIWSTSEELVPLGFQDFLRNHLPDARYTSAEGYHNWVFFRTREFALAVRDFLKKPEQK